jgi:hypothetical protein
METAFTEFWSDSAISSWDNSSKWAKQKTSACRRGSPAINARIFVSASSNMVFSSCPELWLDKSAGSNSENELRSVQVLAA